MTIICSKDKCTGCAACLNVCGKNAISMQADDVGFLQPVIDWSLCVDCGLCTKICPANNPLSMNYPRQCFASVLPDEDDLKQSASGGAATAFARKVISEGGVVYGCSGEDIFHVRHIRIDRMEDIERLRGSKYVQSEIGGLYKLVLSDLKNERLVLFTGTPCQVAGLKSYLRKDYANLITVDLVCHGVPSQKMLNDNIWHYVGEKTDDKLKVEFRRKMTATRSNKRVCQK